MTVDEQIADGAESLLAKSAKTSENDPHMAIAQLILSATILAKIIGMSSESLRDGLEFAIRDANWS